MERCSNQSSVMEHSPNSNTYSRAGLMSPWCVPPNILWKHKCDGIMPMVLGDTCTMALPAGILIDALLVNSCRYPNVPLKWIWAYFPKLRYDVVDLLMGSGSFVTWWQDPLCAMVCNYLRMVPTKKWVFGQKLCTSKEGKHNPNGSITKWNHNPDHPDTTVPEWMLLGTIGRNATTRWAPNDDWLPPSFHTWLSSPRVVKT